MSLVNTMEIEEVKSAEMVKPRPKVGRIPVTIKLHSENDDDAGADWSDTAIETRRGDSQFMFLLVTLFIIVNLSLIALLNQKGKNATPAEPQAAVQQAAPAAPAAKTEIPTLPTKVQAAPVAAPLPSTEPKPATSSVIQPDLSKSYVTPATGTAKATAAPFHPVSVTDQHSAAPAAPVSSHAEAAAAEGLTVVHTENAASPNAAAARTAPASLSPSAGAPAPAAAPAPAQEVSPERATQDLLSVINKD